MARQQFGAGSAKGGISYVWLSCTRSFGKIECVCDAHNRAYFPRVALLLSLIVYVMAARVIWKKRAQLDGFLNPWNESPFSNVITTEIRITHEDKADVNGAQTTEGEPVGLAADAEERAYSVNIEVGSPPTQSMPAILNVRGVTRNIAANESNAEAWLYARVAFLFFFALAITCELRNDPSIDLTDTSSKGCLLLSTEFTMFSTPIRRTLGSAMPVPLCFHSKASGT